MTFFDVYDLLDVLIRMDLVRQGRSCVAHSMNFWFTLPPSYHIGTWMARISVKDKKDAEIPKQCDLDDRSDGTGRGLPWPVEPVFCRRWERRDVPVLSERSAAGGAERAAVRAVCAAAVRPDRAAWLAFLLDGVVCLVYSWAAYWKWLGRSEPLYADDVAAIREAVQIGGRGYITVTWQIAASLLLVVLGTLALAWLARGRLSCRGRAATTGAALLLCVLGYFGVYRSSTLYDRFAAAPGGAHGRPTTSFSRAAASIRSCTASAPRCRRRRTGTTSGRPRPCWRNMKTTTFRRTKSPRRDDDAGGVLRLFRPDGRHHRERSLCRLSCASGRELYRPAVYEYLRGRHDQHRALRTDRVFKLPNFRRPSWSYARYFADQGYTCTGAHPGNEGFTAGAA